MICLKLASVEDHGKQERGSESCWQGETLAERLQLNWITRWRLLTLSSQFSELHLTKTLPTRLCPAPPGYSMERIYHREESILKFSFLLLPFSTLPPLCLSLLSLSSLPFSFLSLFIFLFFVFSSERNYTGQTSPKLAIFLFVLPQSILITSVRYHNTILFPTLNTKLKLSSLLLQKTSKEHTCQHRLDSGSFQGYWLSSLCFDFRAQRHSNL